MKHIGITGGIGSGKSTTARIFEWLGIPVYYADDRAKALMTESDELKRGIIDLFGERAYHEDGSLNRQLLAEKAFSDPDTLKKLNDLVHPAVARDSLLWQKTREEEAVAPYTLREAALLYESGIDQLLDAVIVVSAPEELRIQRVVERDHSNEASVRARMDRQMPQEEKEDRADFVIYNDGIRPLIPQILRIHKKLSSPHA